jgi:hypothetical protein
MVNPWRQMHQSDRKGSRLGKPDYRPTTVRMRVNAVNAEPRSSQEAIENQPDADMKPDDQAIQPGEGADWESSVQRLYDRKTQERRPQNREGDPQRYRQVAQELSAKRDQSFSDVILGDGLIDDRTMIGDVVPRSLPLPSPRGSYPHWRQITGTTFLEHEIIQSDASTQRVDLMLAKVAWEVLQQFGLEETYVLLMLVAKLAKAANPWEEIVELRTEDLLQLNVWERDRELHRGKRLRLAGNWLELVCGLSLLLTRSDRATARFTALRVPLWVLEEMEYGGGMTTALGGEQPEEAQELTIRVGLGLWTEQFTLATEAQKHDSLVEFGHQAETILRLDPHRRGLTAKLAVLGLLLDRLSSTHAQFLSIGAILAQLESRGTMLEIRRLKQSLQSMFSKWNASLHALQKLGWEITFDPATYPVALQPSWHQPEAVMPTGENDQWIDQWLQAQIRIVPPHPAVPAPQAVHLPLTARFTGRNLAQALEMKGLSRAKLAEQLQLDRSMVTYWIKGARLIQPRHREQICEILGPELAKVIR